MKIALVCYHVQERYEHQSVRDENTPLLEYLKLQGLDVHREIWDDRAVDWSVYDVVILKAPWGYHEQLGEFLAWLENLIEMRCRVLNPVEVVRWNSDKHYLTEISAAGLNVIPTKILEPGDVIDFDDLTSRLGSDTLVFKPCVSAGARHTYKINEANRAEMLPKLRELIRDEAFLVQEFAHEVQTDGEWSFLFFNGRFSHAIVKKPGSGDFRVQHYFGGTIHQPDVTGHEISMAQKFVDAFASDCLYARVDGIMRNGVFYLMELELIEPLLFLAYSHDGLEKAQNRYFQALIEKIDP